MIQGKGIRSLGGVAVLDSMARKDLPRSAMGKRTGRSEPVSHGFVWRKSIPDTARHMQRSWGSTSLPQVLKGLEWKEALGEVLREQRDRTHRGGLTGSVWLQWQKRVVRGGLGRCPETGGQLLRWMWLLRRTLRSWPGPGIDGSQGQQG